MKVSIVPAAEVKVPASPLLKNFDQEVARVVVVEQDGEIVASAAIVRMLHVEGVEIADGWRKNPAVGRALMRGIGEALRQADEPALAGTDVETVQRALLRLGAQELPVTEGTKAYWIGRGRWQAFHQARRTSRPRQKEAEWAG